MVDDKKTRVISGAGQSAGDAKDTRILKPGSAPDATRLITGDMPASETGIAGITPNQADPVVGWLVVTKGPGRGCTREIHYGMNSLGRDASERVALDFGDGGISREGHAFVVYDDKNQSFYIQHGGKNNIVRLNDMPVMAPSEMSQGDVIEIGETSLLFVPLCGPDFNWNKT